MSEQTVNITLRVKSDDIAIQRAEKNIKALQSAQKGLARDFAQGAIKADEYEKQMRDLTKEVKQYETAIKSINKTPQIKAPAVGGGGLGGQAGRIGEGLSKVGGALNLSGIQGAGEIGKIVGDIEQLSGTLSQLGGISQSAGASTSAFGAGIGALGLAAGVGVVALAAFQIGIQVFGESVRDAAEKLNANVDAQRRLSQELIRSGGITQDEADRRAKINEQLIADEQRRLAELEVAYKQFEESAGILGGVIKAGLFGEGEEALFQQIEESRANIESYTAEQNALNKAQREGTLITQQASQATQQVVQSTQKTDSAVRQRIASESQYQNSLLQTSRVAAQSGNVNFQGRSRAAFSTRIAPRYTVPTSSGTSSAAKQEESEASKLYNDLSKLRRDFYNKEAEAARKHNDDLEDIRRDAQMSERDAIRSGDIFAIRDIREGLRESIVDAQRDESRRSRESNIGYQQSLAERTSQTNNVTFNITNADPRQTALIVQQQIATTLMRR